MALNTSGGAADLLNDCLVSCDFGVFGGIFFDCPSGVKGDKIMSIWSLLGCAGLDEDAASGPQRGYKSVARFG